MKSLPAILLSLVFIAVSLPCHACSMYKITQDGKTIVGNNEDWLSPNHQFWFEPAEENMLGVMYMGQLDDFAQGAINEAGLVFDGFFEPYLAINNTEGKLDIPISEAIRKVMQTMTEVEEVKAYLETVNLSSLTGSMLVFVDQSGTYLIVEGDEIFTGEEPEKTFSNFYYSQIKSEEEVPLEYYQSGLAFLQSTTGEASLDYCGEAMKRFSQARIAPTQYSTIYDLNNLSIRVYLFQDYSQFVDIDLKEALRKGKHRTIIPELFPEESAGYQHYLKYNNTAHPTALLEELIGTAEISEDEFIAMGFESVVNPIGYEWLYDKNDPTTAAKVFEYGITLMPNNANLYDSLGEAYFLAEDWERAIQNYAKALSLNTQNENAVDQIMQAVKNRAKSQVDKP